jgi:group I intron endonuclease
MNCSIYKITNDHNNKCYIGCTIKPVKDRFNEHISRCKKTKTKFCDALNKYGKDSFTVEVIHVCEDTNEMYRLEKFYIKEYNSFNVGYNLTLGGEGCIGYKHDSDTIKLLKELPNNHKDKTYDEIYGDKSIEQKKKRSESLKKYWSNMSGEEKSKRVENLKKTLKINGSGKCGKNGFSKFIIIDGITYDCWSHAEKTLGINKYWIKKQYDVVVKSKK